MVMEHCHDWQRRAMSVGTWFEFWGPVEDHPGSAVLHKRYRDFGRDLKDLSGDGLKDYLTSELVAEVIGAACAIAYESEKLEQTLSAAQEWVTKYRIKTAQGPTHGEWWGTPEVRAAYQEFQNLTVWGKALDERLDREGSTAGLLPTLADGLWLKRYVSDLVAELRRDVLEDARGYANCGTHTAIVPRAGASAVVRDDRLLLPLPDPPRYGHTYSSAEFSWKENRDVVTFAIRLGEAVDRFMERLLDAFERAQGELEAARTTNAIGEA